MENPYDDVQKNVLQAIKDFGNIKSTQIKLKSQMLANQIQAKQNVIFKMQEKKQEQEMADKRRLSLASQIGRYKMMEKNNTLDDQGRIEMQALMGELGIKSGYDDNMIKEKIARGETLSPGEQQLYNDTIKKKDVGMFNFGGEAGGLDMNPKPAFNPLEGFLNLFKPKPQQAQQMGSSQGSNQNPYQKDYPDAFQEGGAWKVVRNGKKYRIEE